MRRSETSYRVWIQLRKVIDVPDVITCANFGDNCLRGVLGVGVTGGKILPFSIGFRRRPYNTLALRRECVIALTIHRMTVT